MLALDVLARDPLDAEAVAALEAANTWAKTETPATNLYAPTFEALAQVFQKKPSGYTAKTEDLAFRTINNLVRRMITAKSVNLDSVAPVLPILFDYLRPSAFVVGNEQAQATNSDPARAASSLQELCKIGPDFVELALKLNGLGNSRPEVRHAALLFIEASMGVFRSRFRPLTPPVTRLLNDTDEKVQLAASQLLCSFFANAPPHAKADFARELKRQKVENTAELLIRIGLEKSSVAVSELSAGASDAKRTGAKTGAPLIHEITINPLYKMQTLNSEDVDSVAAFRSIIESLQPLFSGKETESNWEARERAVNRLRSLVRGNIIDYPGDVVWALKFLAHDIRQAIYSLRTTLCSAALHLIKDCTQLLKSYFDAVIDPYMLFICEVVASTKKITANLAYITGCSLVLNTSMSTKVASYTHNLVSNQLPASRVVAFKWYHIMFVCHSPDIRYILESTKTVDIVQADIQKGLCDPQSPVRETSRLVFWLFAASWPARAESLGSSLDSQAKKQLLRTQPKELLESYDHNFELHVNRKKAEKAPSLSAPTKTRPATAASSRPVTASRAQSAPAPKVLTAKAHVPDIIRRISRALNDPKPRSETVLEAVDAGVGGATPIEVRDVLAPNDHVASAIGTAMKLIDEMPLEPEETPGQLDTVEMEPAKDTETDYNGEVRTKIDENLSNQKESTQTDQVEGNHDMSEEPDAVQEQEPKGGFNAGMLVETLLESTRNAITQTLEEQGSDTKYDPKFDKDFKINNANDFKDALRSELSAMPTVDISIEAIASKAAKNMQPKFDEYIKMYPESKDAIMEAAKLVESAARKKGTKDPCNDTPPDVANDDSGPAENDANTEDDVVMKDAVKNVAAQIEEDTEGTSSKLSSLSDLLDADDVETMTMGMNVLSYVLRGKRPPKEAVSNLGTLSIPPPDLIGKALNYLFDQAMDSNPQVKELLEKFASADLVAITLSYVGHALVMYVAVHLLPAEALVLTVQVIQPLLNVGAIIDTLFEIANADGISEAALLALGGLLTGFDKLPMSPILRDKAKAALEVIYRLGDLSFDATAFLADWIGFDTDDESTDSDDESDEEKIAAKHARKFERHMATRAPSAVAEAVAVIALERSEPDITASITKFRLDEVKAKAAPSQDQPAPSEEQPPQEAVEEEQQEVTDVQMEDERGAIFAEPISSLHPVSISYMPGAQNNKAVRQFKVSNSSALDIVKPAPEFEQMRVVFSPVPKSQGECLALFESLTSNLEKHSISKQGLVQLISLAKGSMAAQQNSDQNELAFQLWNDLPQIHDRVGRASLSYCERRKFKEEELSLCLILVRTLLENNGFSSSIDQVRILECLCIVSEFELPNTIEYSVLPKTRDALFERNINTDYFIGNLISVFNTGRTSARLFALKTMRQVVTKTSSYPKELQHTIKAAITDDDVRIRKESYPILLNIHMQSESAAKAITEQLSQGQQRLFEYYASVA